MKTELTPVAVDSIGLLVTSSCIQNMRNPNSFTAHDVATAIEDLVPYLRMSVLKDLQVRLDCQVTCFKNSKATPDWNELLNEVNAEILKRQEPKHAK